MRTVAVSGGILDIDANRASKMASAPENRQIRCLSTTFHVKPLGMNVGFRQLRGTGFDLVLANHFSKTAFRLAVGGIPFIFVNHNGFVARPWLTNHSVRIRLAYRVIVRRARRVIALSVEEQMALRRLASDPRQVVLLPNALEESAYEAPAIRGPNADVVFVGHFTPEKGLPILLEALKLFEGWTGRTLAVRCIGFHTDRQARWVHEMAERLDLSSKLDFQQGMPLDALAAELSGARLYVSPSWAEAQSTVLEEAMALGTPVLATAVGAAPELLPPSRLLSPGGSHELAVLLSREWESGSHRAESYVRTASPEWCSQLRSLVYEVIHESSGQR